MSSAAKEVSNAASSVQGAASRLEQAGRNAAAAIAAAAARAAIRPRLKGGPVKPGELYLGGERRPELLKFNDGRSEIIGQSGPELFTVDKPGIVHPTVPSGFPKIEVALPRPKGSNGGAELLNEMRALRRELASQGVKGPNTYQIFGAADPVGATIKLQAEQLRQRVRMSGL
ncbi:hypothetical protein FEK30_00120 (plasmid) [Picosynechococcus sp. PCC 11901]|uniref:hypothetical protein n=1 Tax=Picosynechococcus sp. PCC 11901 TaxID=2579791 RepID=UPI0010FBCD74|nr:hypothetical protein [Picosynechococcus sp. PCC 11901]QCS47977.1 hypothetical protein FEK30_00120 [Picosynechococcus sp. PCC 11901]